MNIEDALKLADTWGADQREEDHDPSETALTARATEVRRLRNSAAQGSTERDQKQIAGNSWPFDSASRSTIDPASLLPEREGQAETMTVAGDQPDAGHWYSPAAARKMIAEAKSPVGEATFMPGTE